MSTPLALVDNAAGSGALAQTPSVLATLSLGQAMQVAKSLFASGYFATVKNPEQAFAKILAGQELGIGPMQALANIHIVEGKPTLDASLIRARIKSSGKYDVRTIASTDKGCTLRFFERGQKLGDFSFTEEDAKRADLLTKANWKKYPKAMYLSRATSGGAKEFCPDVFGGPIYTPEDLEVLPPEESASAAKGEIKNVTPAEDTPPAQTQKNDTQKLTEALQSVTRLIVDREIPESVVEDKWADMMGDALAQFPVWQDGQYQMLRHFYGVLKKWEQPKTATQALDEDLNDFAEPKAQAHPPAEQPAPKAETPEPAQSEPPKAVIDPKILDDVRGMIALPDVNALCVVAAKAGMTAVQLLAFAKQATDGKVFTRPTYAKAMETLEKIATEKAAGA